MSYSKVEKPNFSYFKLYGCTCFLQNNGTDNHGKFDASSDEAIFYKFALNSKAYCNITYALKLWRKLYVLFFMKKITKS